MDKPAKPTVDFPLFPHACGSWAKKIKGKLHYFGPWADPDAALAKYCDSRDDLQAGRTPAAGVGITIAELCDDFLVHKRHKVDSSELSERSWSEYRTSCLRIIRVMGRGSALARVRPADFDTLRADIAKTRKATALTNEVRRCRSVFKYAVDSELVESIRMGQHFIGATRKALRQHRRSKPPQSIPAAELRTLIDAADVHLKPMILLGLNCGFGQMDLAMLPKTAIDWKAGWIRFPRPKTEIDRECPLWPQTLEALKAADAKRHKPKHADPGLFFITLQGYPLVRFKPIKGGRMDAVGQAFRKLLIANNLKQPGLGFYTLRHIFRTVADDVKDSPAIKRIMGHSDEDKSDEMRTNYVESIDPGRLVVVSNHVRTWLFGA